VSLLLTGGSPRLISFAEALAASFGLAGGLALVGWAYLRFRGREGLGFGDVKMLGTIGAFLGLERGLLVILLGSLVGTLGGVAWIKLRGGSLADYELPFGSFLGAAALWVALFSAGAAHR
jgi:leader peptidase (prepilin peptidase)/N-methyltransferase